MAKPTMNVWFMSGPSPLSVAGCEPHLLRHGFDLARPYRTIEIEPRWPGDWPILRFEQDDEH